MDTSSEYIRMCDSWEIQKLRQPTKEILPDGRVKAEWDFKAGDVFVWYDRWNNSECIETVGTTVYSPYYYNEPGDERIDVPMVGFDEGDGGYSKERIIWLPRQGQIQALLGLTNPNDWYSGFPSDDGYPMWDVVHHSKSPQFFHFDDKTDTGEKFWLQYYMYLGHDKHWDGKSWESPAKNKEFE